MSHGLDGTLRPVLGLGKLLRHRCVAKTAAGGTLMAGNTQESIVVEWKSGGKTYSKTCCRRALHFGWKPPLDVEAVAMRRRPGVAEHHGKVFWGQDGYRFINLTELPTLLFRGSRRTKPEFELNPIYPQCTVSVNDKLVIGDTTFVIRKLDTPAVVTHVQRAAISLPDGLRVRLFVKGGPHFSRAMHFEAEQVVPLVRLLRQYVSRHELVRQAAGWLFRALCEIHLSPPNREEGQEEDKQAEPDQVEYAGVKDVRWWELAPPELEPGTEPAEGNVRSQPVGPFPWGRLIKRNTEIVSSGMPFHIEAFGRMTVALAIGVRMAVREVQAPPQAEGRPARSRLAAQPQASAQTAEAPPAYLFSIELDKGEPRPEYWALLYHFGSLLSDALSDLAVRRQLLKVEFERDFFKRTPEIFHKISTPMSQVLGFLRSESPAPGASRTEWRSFDEHWAQARECADYAHDLARWGQECHWRTEQCCLRLRDLASYLKTCPGLRGYWGHRTEASQYTLSEAKQRLVFAFDEVAVSLVLWDLIENAKESKANASRTDPVCVSVWLRPSYRRVARRKILDYVALRVLDNGDGLEEEEVSSIFQARFRNATGRGFGTAIVSKLVYLHRGFIEVASERKVGTAVSIYLPYVLERELTPEAEALQDYREYARAHLGAGRWTSFDAAARQHPHDYNEALNWMRSH